MKRYFIGCIKIRDWTSGHEKIRKGVTLTEYELRKLKELIDAEIAFLDSGL